MTPTEPPPRTRAVTDPARIRALAHPVRLDLLHLLDGGDALTATECAERLGETVANCSFHLRTLAKAGFVEPAAPRGREKPWRAVAGEINIEPDRDDPASRRAVVEVAGLSMLREVERVRAFLEAHHDRPDSWADTVTVKTTPFWATAEELRQLIAGLHALTQPFQARDDDPSQRPEGARLAHLFATVNPDSFPDDPGAPDVAGTRTTDKED